MIMNFFLIKSILRNYSKKNYILMTQIILLKNCKFQIVIFLYLILCLYKIRDLCHTEQIYFSSFILISNYYLFLIKHIYVVDNKFCILQVLFHNYNIIVTEKEYNFPELYSFQFFIKYKYGDT